MSSGSAMIVRPRVDHHRGVDVAEVARVDEPDLAATALLGGGAQHADAQTQVGGHGRERQRGPERGGTDDVVATGVTDSGQGVVLRADGDVQRSRPEPPTRAVSMPAAPRSTSKSARASSSASQPLARRSS